MLLPYAIKKIRNFEKFKMEFVCCPLTKSMQENLTSDYWSKFIEVTDDYCEVSGIGVFLSVLKRKKYRLEIIDHFHNLGWKCQILEPSNFLGRAYYKVIISYPKQTFLSKIWCYFSSWFNKKIEIKKLPAHPYR